VKPGDAGRGSSGREFDHEDGGEECGDVVGLAEVFGRCADRGGEDGGGGLAGENVPEVRRDGRDAEPREVQKAAGPAKRFVMGGGRRRPERVR
jgi:hypothetical protein